MANEKKQPNILFIMTDQFRSDFLSCHGGPAKTPNLDRIIREGVSFSQCATVAPLCVPARVSLFSGKYPHTTGAWDNYNYALSTDANIWTKEFRKLGYDTSLFGKTHLHCDTGDLIAREYIPQGYGFDTVNETPGPHAGLFAQSHMTNLWKEKGYYDAFCEDMHTRMHPHVKPSPLPLELYYDVYVGEKGNEYLENYEGDKPWFCHVSFGGPHEPWDTPEPYASMFDPADMPEPTKPMVDANPDRPKGEIDRMRKWFKAPCPDPELAKQLRADYCGGIALIDDQIGRIFDTIEKRGEWDNTIVLFTSDHGEMNGDQGLVMKRMFYDGALFVPLIIRTPETAKNGGGVVNDSLVSLLDVGPTLVELAGGKLKYDQCGISLCPVLDGKETKMRDYVLSEYAGEVTYVDENWKISTNRNGEVYFLIDRKNDPDEQYNLACSPEAEEITAELLEKLMMAVAENQCLKPSVLMRHIDYPTRNNMLARGYRKDVV